MREFLGDYISDPGDLLAAIFKKGYEWPFSAARIYSGGHYLSSAVDLAVFSEHLRGRRVFLDYRENPRELLKNGAPDFSLAGEEAHAYLQSCGSVGASPIERLTAMNEPAIELYRSRGVDLYREMLEISVCAQHCNGGIEVDKWYESAVPGLFIIGEAAGVFGVTRPGGSALNSTQVGGIRAAEKIVYKIRRRGAGDHTRIDGGMISGLVFTGEDEPTLKRIFEMRAEYGRRMTECCSFLRDEKKIRGALESVLYELRTFSRFGARSPRQLSELYINRDILLTQASMLSSAGFYIADGGLSRGSYLVTDRSAEDVIRDRREIKTDTEHAGVVLTASIEADGSFRCAFEPCRPIPGGEYWFETVYRDYRMGEIYDK